MIYKNKISESVLKQRIVKRILYYSLIYQKRDLEDLTLEELRRILKSSLLHLTILSQFKWRHKSISAQH